MTDLEITRRIAPPIPEHEVPDPPSTAAGLRDRSRWSEINLDGIGRVYVVAYDPDARVAAVYDARNARWRTMHRVEPDVAALLPAKLIETLADELKEITK